MKTLNNKKILSAIFAFALIFTSCDQDVSVEDIERFNSTNAVVEESSITVKEGNDASFTIVQENLIERKIDAQELYAWVSGQIGIRIVGGTATEGVDYSFNLDPIYPNVSIYLLQDGYYYPYDATQSLKHVVSNILTINNDGITEGEETIELQFFPVGLAGVIINDTLTIKIND